ncbi:MAG: ABC transporter substrate-binding protein [Deltaproteobacteria bacterium]|nr:ABC transporter substrate-binding protein [Deltaproteobacteria bacterium]MBI3064741.1 ABC transporter substrate-binding protein [Deltaproteobacteria bacterium]
MHKRITRRAFCSMLLALPFPAQAQQPKKVPLIGYLLTTSVPTIVGPQMEIFRQALRDLGYIEGNNILIEYRYIEGRQDRVPSLIAELVQLKVDVLIVGTLTSIRAAKQATSTIPIIMVTSGDPVATGIVDSLARPGGNITGLTLLTRELNGKRIELLKEAVPGISRVGVLWDPRGPGPAIAFKEYEAAAGSLKIKLQSLEVRDANPDFEGAFKAAVKGRASALIEISSSVFNRHARRIADFAIKNRLPSMCEASEFVEAGCLMSYSSSRAEIFRRLAVYVDKILKGTKPADIPVEQPMRFELVVNLKTAKQIGVTIDPNLLVRAQKVIR